MGNKKFSKYKWVDAQPLKLDNSSKVVLEEVLSYIKDAILDANKNDIEGCKRLLSEALTIGVQALKEEN